MKRPRLRGRWPWLGLLIVPALIWAIVLAVVPTGWARARLIARLAAATGRSVRIGELRLGVLGNLRVIDLEIAEHATPSDPWLRVAEARIDVHLGQVLCGHCRPNEIEVEGVSLRIWRRGDGTPEIGDLLRAGPAPSRGGGHGGDDGPGGIALKVKGANIRIVDDPSRTRLDLVDVEAKATCGHRMVALGELRGKLNGGSFELAARLDRDPAGPRFEAEVRATGIRVDSRMPALAYLVPVVAGATDSVGGRCGLRLDVRGQGTTRAEVRRSLRGGGTIALDPIDLQGSKFLEELDVLGDWQSESRVGSVAADFEIGEGRIATEDLTIRVSRFPFVLGGWTDFDGRFDYTPRVDRIAAELPRAARDYLPELHVNFDQLAGLRIRGAQDRVEVTVHGHPLTGDPGRPVEEQARFRETARRIRDRFFR